MSEKNFSTLSICKIILSLLTDCHTCNLRIFQRCIFFQLRSTHIQPHLSLLRIMSPILQTLITLTTRILLRLLLLRKMPLAVRHNLSHVIYVILVVLAGVLFRVLLQDGDDLAPGVVPDCFTAAVVF